MRCTSIHLAFQRLWSRHTSVSAVFPIIMAGVSLTAVGCGPPSSAALEIGKATVVVDGEAHQLEVRRGDEVVWRTTARDVAFKKGAAFFDMQFGMFDIQEDRDPYVAADRLVILEASEESIRFELRDEDDVAVAVAAVTGGSKDEVKLTIDAANGADRITIATPCQPDHHFIGLGAQSADVDHRGQIVPLWVSEQGVGKSDTDDLPTVWQLLGRRHTTHAPMPMMVRSDATALLVDTPAFSRFDLCASDVDVSRFEVWDTSAHLSLVVESSVLAAQQGLASLQGRTRLLPPYTFAPWNDAIFSEETVREFAAFLREQHIPSSVIWSEDWRGGQDAGELYRLDEDWRLDRDVYPTYEDMAVDLRANGYVHQVYFNTFVTEGGDVFDEITAAQFDVRKASDGSSFLFTGADREFSPTALLDLTNDDAVAFVKEDHLKEALRLGARGWMADFAEWMPVEDVALHSGEDPALVHNRYAVDWARINREAVTEAGLLDEVVLFSRSGHLGSPAVVDVFWAGDQRTSFQVDDGLPTIIPLGVGTAVTGFDVYAHDIAGYQSTTNDPTDKELFFRWTELGALTPVMRTHHGTHARFNHNLRSDEESTAHWKRYAEIHVRLYPYLRALHVAAATGRTDIGAVLGEGGAALKGAMPMWMPMPLLHPEDDVWAITDQVYLGPGLLVAPVVTAGQVRRDVVLPTGRFVPFPLPGAVTGTLGASQTSFTGPVTITVDAALGEIPVLMPAGAIVPMTAQPAETLLDVDDAVGIADLESTTGDRVVVIALGKSGSFVEEDGASYVLRGNGTTLPAGVDAEGGVDVVGNQVLTEDGYTLTLSGHPTTRNIRLLFR